MHTVERLLAIGAVTSTLVIPSTAFAQDTPTVSVQDELFVPPQVEFVGGDTLTWSMDGAEQHTITADGGSFDSGIMNLGDTFAFTFSAPGTYPYYCQIHGAPGGVGMAGTVVVD